MQKNLIVCTVVAFLVAGCATKEELKSLSGKVAVLDARQDQTDKDFTGLATSIVNTDGQLQKVAGDQKQFAQDVVELTTSVVNHEDRLDGLDRRLTAVEGTANESAIIIAGTGLKAMYDNKAGSVLSAQEVEEILREKKYATAGLVQGVQNQLDNFASNANQGITDAKSAAATADAKAVVAQKTADEAKSSAAGARSVADGKLGAGDLNSRLTQYAKATEVKLAMAGLSRRFLGYPVQVEEPFKRVSDTDVKTADGKGKPNLGPARDYRWLYTNPGWKIETCVYQWDAPPGAPRWKWVDVIRGGDFLTYSGFNSDGKRVEIRVEAPKTVFPWPDDEDERRAKAALDRVRGGQRVEREYQCPRYPTRCGNPTCTRCKG